MKTEHLVTLGALAAGVAVGANLKRIKKGVSKAGEKTRELAGEAKDMAVGVKDKMMKITETAKESVEDAAKKVWHKAPKKIGRPARVVRKAAVAAV